MRRLTILHVTPYWADAWAYGGIPRVVGALTRALATAGHRVTVCATDACSSTARLAPGHARVAEGLDLRIFPNRSNRLAHDWQCFTPVGLDAWLRAHAAEFDVAHLHACRNLPGLLAARRLRQAGVPYVVTPNGTAPLIERRILAKRVVDRLGGRRMLQEAAAVLAVSAAERTQLAALGLPTDRLHVVPNPLDAAEFAPPVARGAFRARHALGDGPLVVFLGKITPRKRIDVVARAFAAARPDARLVLAGNDMGGLAPALRLLTALGAAARTVVTGLLTGAARLEALADADVVVYPSSEEVFGLVPLEALMAGTPVVVADDSGCGEVVREVTAATGGGWVVPVGDAEALRRAIDRVLEDRQAWRAAATAAGRIVAQRFAAKAVVAALDAVYQQVSRPAPVPGAAPATGVSVVVPVKNGGSTLAATIAAIGAQADGRPFEIVVVDDRSHDDGAAWLAEAARAGRLRLLTGAGRGASAAMNLGIAAVRFPIVCQVDQDVRLEPGWMARLVAVLEADPRIGAVQGQYVRDPAAPVLVRVMALDLERRYAALRGADTTHVCTGNVAYRAAALRDAGPFDETLGYGNDNDMSYRLRAAGWRLAHCAAATSVHRWREGLGGYWRQQYGFGYGRLDVVARHPHRILGDSVSPAAMMLHPVLLAAAGGLAAVAAALWWLDHPWHWAAVAAGGVVAALALERAVAGVRAFVVSGDAAGLLFPAVHLVRDFAWVAAILTWSCRRVRGDAPRPGHSMWPRPVARTNAAPGFIPRPERTLAIVPAHNEAAAIAGVVADLRDRCPALDVLVVDDGSTDATADVLTRCGVTTVHLPERMGVGSAVRTGLRYARRHGYDSAVRVDGDGQHGAADIARLLAPLHDGRADVVVGSRFLDTPSAGRPAVRATQRLLAWGLAALTAQPVTDPTSGFCAIGPRAMRLLADHHPPGYAEPELRLLLCRSGLHVEEVAVAARPRLGGRTTLTPLRLAEAGVRVLLAMVMVPLRGGLRGAGRG